MKSFCYPYDAKITLYKAFYRVLNHLTYNITMHFGNLFNHGAKAPRKASDKADSVYGVMLDLTRLSPTETDPALLKERLDKASKQYS